MSKDLCAGRMCHGKVQTLLLDALPVYLHKAQWFTAPIPQCYYKESAKKEADRGRAARAKIGACQESGRTSQKEAKNADGGNSKT